MDWGVNASGLVAGDPSEAMGEFFYGGKRQVTPYHAWQADTLVYLWYLFSEPWGFEWLWFCRLASQSLAQRYANPKN